MKLLLSCVLFLIAVDVYASKTLVPIDTFYLSEDKITAYKINVFCINDYVFYVDSKGQMTQVFELFNAINRPLLCTHYTKGNK